MAYFIYKDKKVYYKTLGKGQPLLLVHANAASSKTYMFHKKFYAKHFKIILIDLPGHGKSDRIDHFDVDFWAENAKVCIQLLKELNFEKTHIMGTGGGALIALNMALKEPELINKVVADSFEGENCIESWILKLKDERKIEKKRLLIKFFHRLWHGKDWRKVLDLDTEMYLSFLQLKKSFFNKDLSLIKNSVLLTGSTQDEFIKEIEPLYEGISNKMVNGETYFFDQGAHPAMISNIKLFKEVSLNFLLS